MIDSVTEVSVDVASRLAEAFSRDGQAEIHAWRRIPPAVILVHPDRNSLLSLLSQGVIGRSFGRFAGGMTRWATSTVAKALVKPMESSPATSLAADVVAASLSVAHGGDSQDRFAAVRRAGPGHPDRIFVFVGLVGSGELTSFSKVGFTKAESQLISREFRTLTLLRADPNLRDALPNPLALASESHVAVATYAFVPGRPFPLRRYLEDPQSKWAAQASFDFLTTIARLDERLPVPDDADSSTGVLSDMPSIRQWLAEATPGLALGAPKFTWQHGDPMISNCLINNKEMTIIDYEHSNAYPEWFDLSFGPLSTLFLLSRNEKAGMPAHWDTLMRPGRFLESVASVYERHWKFDVSPAVAWPATARLASMRRPDESRGSGASWLAIAEALEEKGLSTILERLA